MKNKTERELKNSMIEMLLCFCYQNKTRTINFYELIELENLCLMEKK